MDVKTERKKNGAPSTSNEFDKIYDSAISYWVWNDTRIPKELKELIINENPQSSLELGCGLGNFSGFAATQGVAATAVDFSAVAIERAKKRTADELLKPNFIVGDVTDLHMLDEQFDVSFDIGCFHCLDEAAQQKYVREVHRLLKPGSVHLIWALDHSPADIPLDPKYIADTFQPYFELIQEKFSRRRVIASHWYWLKKGGQ